jgi:2-hydroxy-3-oxopropionate reductase
MTVGFIGIGRMGLPLAENLLAQERALMAFDINPEATAPLAEKQARIAQSPAEVAAECDVVFACLPSIGSLNEVVWGSDGICHGVAHSPAHSPAMKFFVNLGTMGTEAVLAIEAALGKQGVGVLDAPITGGVKRAQAGDITVIASGPEAVFNVARRYLQSFARDIHHVGDKVGQAQVVKVCNNIMSFTNLAIAGEALVMAAKGGVDPEKALAVFNSGSGQNSATLSKVPDAVMNRSFNLSAPMHITQKDAMLWRMESERLQVPQTVAAATYQVFRQAAAMGLGDGDLSEIVKVVERAAGFELPKTRD